MLILAIIVFGMGVGWLVQIALGRSSRQVDWTMALVAGLGGSLLGGLLGSLIAGDGLALKPSGLIGSFVGAVIITLGWQAYNKRQRAAERS
ncbi:MAG: GlsB/YeaQ/YmgE family stress response membrane protein [Ilumatobacter sp.]